jgi:single-strand DNA-binding protein
MNKLTIIGGIVRDPELRTTATGLSVCTFTVAVNRRRTQEGQPDADFFRVTAWRALGENCAKYLTKGRKVCVVGPVSISTYTGNDGKTRANMEVTADDVEFLTPKENAPTAPQQAADAKEDAYIKAEREAIKNEGERVYVPVDGDDDLPF